MLRRRVTLALVVVVVGAFAAAACGGDDDDDATGSTATPGATEPAPEPPALTLTSPAFADGEPIPVRFTCDGENVSPPLAWTGVPDDAAELALIVNDPDAGTDGFVHWVMWGFPAEDAAIAAGKVPRVSVQGSHGANGEGYTGPCPPSGVHHYEFELFAVSESPQVVPGADAQALRDAVADITVATTELVGTYERAQG
jgi:Raf kinase inhibitor-like YbhB/YbcL family protein